MFDGISRRQVLTGTAAVAAASVLPAQPVVDAGGITFGPLSDPKVGGLWAGLYDRAGKLVAQSVNVEVKAVDHTIALNVPAFEVWQTGEMEVRINRGEHTLFTFDKKIEMSDGDSLKISDLMIELT